MRTKDMPMMIGRQKRREFLKFAGGALAWAALSPISHAKSVTQLAARIEETPASHPLLPGLRRVAQSLEAFESVDDYQAVMVREELIGRKITKSRMEMKLRHQPFSVYVKILEPHAGREAIFQEGKNDGKIQAHDIGLAALVGTLSLDPLGKTAMEGSRHPMTMAGIRRMAETVLENWLALTSHNEVALNYYPNARIGDLSCEVYESQNQKNTADTPFQSTSIYFDAKTGFPIRAQSFGFPERPRDPAPLVEDYMYLSLKTNVGLTDLDFDVENPAYNF